MSNRMKNKSRYYEEDEETVDMRKESQNKRRPHKNLVRFWEQHQEDYDEIDEFYYNK